MKIGNPLPQLLNTVQIGGIAAPSVLATLTNLAVPNNTSQVSTLSATQVQLIITNQDTANSVYITDTSITTFQVGTKLGPGQIAVLDGSYQVRLANNSGATVVCGLNQIKSS